MNLTSQISVIIPVYNAERSLQSLVDRLEAVLQKVASTHEIVLVDDGSADRSWEVICDLASRVPSIVGFSLMRNYGQHNALLCGIRAARYDIIVTMDDDLQNPPEEIPRLLEKLSEGADVIYGVPDKEQHGIWRNTAARMTKLVLQSAMGAEIARNVSAFRAFRNPVRGAFADYRSPFVSIDVLLTWGTTNFSAVTVRHDARSAGSSQYTVRKLVAHALNMMTSFSTLPLQVASVVGFLFTLFGIGTLLYVLGRYFIQGAAVPGFAFLACAIAIFSGAQLFSMGIIGEYLARMHFRTMEQPTYVIRAGVGADQLPSTPPGLAPFVKSDNRVHE